MRGPSGAPGMISVDVVPTALLVILFDDSAKADTLYVCPRIPRNEVDVAKSPGCELARIGGSADKS
jgi:hypothetical protein